MNDPAHSLRAGARATVAIEDLSSEGSGVGRLPDGRAVFVPRTVPGEEIRIGITRARKSFAQGEVEELLTSAEDRREPPCPLYDRCGGCQLQHMRYGAQLRAKETRIEETLRRIGGIEVGEVEVEPAESEYHYRNRVTFTLRRLRGGRVVAGFHHRERTGHVIEVEGECLLPEEPVGRAWVALRAGWGAGASKLPAGGMLRLTLRAAGERVILVVEGGRTGNEDLPAARELLSTVPGLAAVWHRPEGEEEPFLVVGEESVEDRWYGELLRLRSSAFLQVNRSGAEALHSSVLKELGNPEGLRIVDGYCGVGGYGRRLARQGAIVVGIEEDRAAVQVARTDAPYGFEVVRGRVEAALADHLPADRVILNPPRAGLDERIPQLLRENPVERILLVSCDPATLARDLSRLLPAYRIRRVRGFDLFPQTVHVETVVTLDAAGSGS